MPNTLTLGNMTIPFDAEIFSMYFEDEPDMMSDALIASGAMEEDQYINRLIEQGSDIYTIPFYGLIDYNVAPDNYDGRTDINVGTMSAASQSGVVYGRAKAWGARQFARDITAANPMQALAARTRGYWSNYKQGLMLGITDALLENTKMASHKKTVTTLTETTIGDAAEEIFGDKASSIALAVMHSSVAQFYKDKQVVEYWKYTDPNGVQREMNLYDINGIKVVVYNGVGGTAAGSGTPATYNTYLFGAGALRHGSAPVTLPVEVGRDPLKNGGEDFLINRLRETIHVDGATFKKPTSGYTDSPTDAQLKNKADWDVAYSDVTAIPVAKLVTPGIR